MTDKDIIKALEYCSNEDGDCRKCPLYNSTDEHCSNLVNKGALDIINRQQAEIEKLKNRFFCKIVIDEEQVRKYINEKVQEFELDIKSIKAEAVKEFAENTIERVEKAKLKYQRLCKEQGEEMEEYMHIHFNGIIGIIDNLLKETVGDE